MLHAVGLAYVRCKQLGRVLRNAVRIFRHRPLLLVERRLAGAVARHAGAEHESPDLVRGRRCKDPRRVLVYVLGDDGRRKDAQALRRDRSAMVHHIDINGQTGHGLDVAAVGLLKPNAFRQVLKVPADHVVAPGDIVSHLDEFVGEVASEEASSARDKNFHSRPSQVAIENATRPDAAAAKMGNLRRCEARRGERVRRRMPT